MKKIGMVFALLAASILFTGCGNNVVLKSQKDKASYTLGVSVGKNLKGSGLEINKKALFRGIADGLADKKNLLSDGEMQEIFAATQQEIMIKQQERSAQQGAKNKQEGEAYLTANKKKPGVITLPSGLQYKVIKEGGGRSPKITDTVLAHYRGTLIDGTEFDSSYKRGQAASFPVSGVIRGWTEALQMMKVGSKWELYIPADLAYGEQGAGQMIGPNAVLIFEVELVGIK
ncbi:MAG: FKBP-type peptidyl-prolyl cis-trans isomerase [Bacillota bacterium]